MLRLPQKFNNPTSCMLYSVIIPVYNRPGEVQELLESLCSQSYTNFEVLVVEDGSTETCKHIVHGFSGRLNVTYYFKENSGQGFSRNFGFGRAKGDYFIVFDSDCLIPPDYFEIVDTYIRKYRPDAYGGPDRAHPSFTPLQKAISYSMTSPFTTGGIRGNKRHSGTFHPRSFNMGISRQVFEKTGGYKITRMGEDIEFSLRIIEHGFKTVLIPRAYVFHKRRTSLKQFFKQLHFFGRARINISRFYPSEVKGIHMLPALFTVALAVYISLPLWQPFLFALGTVVLACYLGGIVLHSSIKNNSLTIGMLSAITSIIQLTAYGIGFLTELWRKLEE